MLKLVMTRYYGCVQHAEMVRTTMIHPKTVSSFCTPSLESHHSFIGLGDEGSLPGIVHCMGISPRIVKTVKSGMMSKFITASVWADATTTKRKKKKSSNKIHRCIEDHSQINGAERGQMWGQCTISSLQSCTSNTVYYAEMAHST